MKQEKVWNNIAQEWYEFKKPGQQTLEFVKKQKGKLLDLGSGSGRYLIKKPDLKFYLVDFSKEMIKLAKQKTKKLKIKDVEFHISEVDKIPFEDNFFDSAIYADALHCIKNKQKRKKSLKELCRVLKPEAKARINVWNKESGRFKNKKKHDIVRWREKGAREYYFYTEKELKKELKKAGFKIISQTSQKNNKPFHTIVSIVQKPKK